MADRMTGLERLGAHVASSLDQVPHAEDAAARVRARLARGEGHVPVAPLRVHRGRVLGLLAIAAAVALVAFFGWRRGETRVLTFVVTAPGVKAESGLVGSFLAAPAHAELPVAFSDGTRLAIGAGARARVAEVTPRGARVLLESGVVHASVVHRDDTRWLVDAGPFEVKVTGTRFDVAWQPEAEALVVTLHEGSVVVTGCGLADGTRVGAGQQLRASCRSGETTLTTIEAAATATAAGALPDAPAEVVAAAFSAPRSSSSAVAISAPTAAPIAIATATGPIAAPNASELLARANVERYAGHFDAATEDLDAVRRRFRGTDSAATAAFELGRIAFDAHHDFAAAGDWFDTYLRERPSGALAREALGRAIEARHRAGDGARAEQLAARYVAAYPEGPHAALARRLATRPGNGTATGATP